MSTSIFTYCHPPHFLCPQGCTKKEFVFLGIWEGGVKGPLKFFQKFVRFGSRTLPLVVQHPSLLLDWNQFPKSTDTLQDHLPRSVVIRRRHSWCQYRYWCFALSRQGNVTSCRNSITTYWSWLERGGSDKREWNCNKLQWLRIEEGVWACATVRVWLSRFAERKKKQRQGESIIFLEDSGHPDCMNPFDYGK